MKLKKKTKQIEAEAERQIEKEQNVRKTIKTIIGSDFLIKKPDETDTDWISFIKLISPAPNDVCLTLMSLSTFEEIKFDTLKKEIRGKVNELIAQGFLRLERNRVYFTPIGELAVKKSKKIWSD